MLIMVMYKTSETPKIDNIFIYQKKLFFIKMLSIFGVSLVLYFVKILSGSKN